MIDTKDKREFVRMRIDICIKCHAKNTAECTGWIHVTNGRCWAIDKNKCPRFSEHKRLDKLDKI